MGVARLSVRQLKESRLGRLTGQGSNSMAAPCPTGAGLTGAKVAGHGLGDDVAERFRPGDDRAADESTDPYDLFFRKPGVPVQEGLRPVHAIQ